TRLRPITHTSAKQLVPIANKPILFYGLEDMAAAGITDVGIIIGETGEEIRAAVGDGSAFGLEVTYLPQAQPLGLAHCVLIARDFLGDEDFVMYLGDNMLEQGLTEFVSRFEEDRERANAPTLGDSTPAPVAQILLAEVEDPRQFGVAEVDAAGHVLRLVEKPDVPPSNLALVGVYLFDHHVIEAVESIAPSPRGELEITDAIQWLIDQGHRVRHEVLDGWWIDTGKKDPLLECNYLVLDRIQSGVHGDVDVHSHLHGRVEVAKGAQIVNSTIRGPVVIGERTEVVNSYIGPYTSVSSDCEIRDAELEHSVVLQESRIVGISGLTDSLIGRQVVVERSGQRPRATRLMLGDHSRIDLE
ncbi:MAG: glucose-1-phosphate thymidylyltransferase, partial [Acidimicrobiales bacterium]|nr:glucose-1-phosphate thymidylyltransferase [Acidimicrobiales bacterium]